MRNPRKEVGRKFNELVDYSQIINTPGGTGAGTVTSVAMTVPIGLTITGSPITTSGTLSLTLTAGYSIPTTASQTNWDTAYTNRITSLTTTGSSGSATLVSNVLNIPTYTLSGLGGFANPMTLLGDIIYGGASGSATRLAGNTTSVKQFLSQTGTGTISAIPSWSAILGSDITGAALTSTNDTNVTITLGGTPATSLLRATSITLGWTGTLADARITSAATWNAKENALTFSAPLSRATNTISIPAATTSVNGYLTSTDWTTFNNKQNAITLTTTGTSGAATLVGNTLNIPQYSGTNIYNSDGTLTGTRVVTMGTNNLSFTSTARTSATAFQISSTQTTANATDTLDAAIGVDYTFNAATGTELVSRAMNFRTYSTGAATLTNMRAWNIGSNTSAGSTTTNLDQIYIEKGVTAAGSVTNNRGIFIASMQGTNQAGLVINDLGTTGNTTAILIGAASGAIPTGDFGIYQVDTKVNVFGGYLGVGITPTIPLDIVRGTAGTMIRSFYESAAFSYNGDTKLGIYTSSATATDGAALYLGQTNLLNSASQYGGFELQYRYNSSTTENFRINYVSRLATGAVSTSTSDLLLISKTGAATFLSSVTATSFVKTSGTSAQILAADGSVITAGTNITISGGTISASGTGGSVSQLSGFADQTIYNLLNAPAAGPQIKIRYDSATTNRYMDIGIVDNTTTNFYTHIRFFDTNSITAYVPFTQSINQNQTTQLKISNTTAGTISNALLNVTSDTTAGYTLFGKLSSSYTATSILTASDSAWLNYTLGDMALLNTYASGKIKFAAGNATTPQMTLTSDGHLLINTTTNGTYFLDVNGDINVTGKVNIAAGTATRAPIDMTPGSAVLKTTPLGGDLEVDVEGKMYYTHNTSERGVVPAYQFVSPVSTAPYSAAFTTARPIFSGLTGTTNGAVTLKANTRYHFEMLVYFSNMSATNSTFGIGFTGTTLVTNMLWQSQASKSSSMTTAGADANTLNFSSASPLNSNNTIICTAATGTTAYARCFGWIRTGATGGTFIPNINLSASATPSLNAGSYFKITAFADNTTETLGAWS